MASDPDTEPTVAERSGLTEHGIDECYRYALRLTGGNRDLTDDLVQQTCEAAALAATQGKPVTVGWMIVAARRRFADHLRRKRLDDTRFERLAAVTPLTDEPDWDAVSGGEALGCLGRLSADHRAALVFRYVDDLPVAEVADLLDRSVSATESLLARARRELAQHVTELNDG